MRNTFEQTNFFPELDTPRFKILTEKTCINVDDESGAKGILVVLKNESRKKQKINLTQTPAGKIEILSRNDFTETERERIIDHVRQEIIKKEQENSPVPKCPRCKIHHWPQDSCGDWN